MMAIQSVEQHGDLARKWVALRQHIAELKKELKVYEDEIKSLSEQLSPVVASCPGKKLLVESDVIKLIEKKVVAYKKVLDRVKQLLLSEVLTRFRIRVGLTNSAKKYIGVLSELVEEMRTEVYKQEETSTSVSTYLQLM